LPVASGSKIEKKFIKDKMNIVQIIPGSGGSFYCGNCLRDSKFVDALRKEGHQVIKVPMYLPLFADEHDIADIPVFYGAISIYLKQLYPVFRKAPSWFDKLLNSKPILKMAASMSGSTDAKGLDEMTISMLMGEDGKQQEELGRMVDWIAGNCHPDIIHISNALLLGLAHRIREKINVPVVCSLQDEDVWVDAMKPESRETIWSLMHEKAADVDAFIAVSHYFAGVMEKKLKLHNHRIFPVYLGVDPLEYPFADASGKERTIGYISRMCYDNGLDIAVDAFILLKKDPGFGDVKLYITGGSTTADSSYLSRLKKHIRKAGLENDIIFHDSFEVQGRKEFFSKVALGTVPVRKGEAFGIYLPEMMASGIPILQPALGAFPEIVELSGGGRTYSPNTPGELARNWAKLLADNELLSSLSHQARKGVEQHFDIHVHASEMVRVYELLIEERKQHVAALG
jgi:glycosyltransferase involved in cell wall biosynthesis